MVINMLGNPVKQILMNSYRKVSGTTSMSEWIELLQLINIGISKASLNRQARVVDSSDPLSWEYSGFSQNGEDGIVEYVLSHLKNPNRSFVEIGASDGTENNTSLLAICKRYAGLMIEGDEHKSNLCGRFLKRTGNPYVSCINEFVTLANVKYILASAPFSNPDILSLDIDGVDYFIAKEILASGFRPKLFVVEYNPAYGPDLSISVGYKEDFNWILEHASCTYFGCSIEGWKKFFISHDYQFVTVDSSGTNAFFIDSGEFHPFITESFKPASYIDGRSQLFWSRKSWQERFEVIKEQKYEYIS
jgi:hypothetical protein